MAKIVHSADMHFDAPLIGFSPEKAEICREEQYSSFERTINIVKEYRADALLLSGDIFENEYVSYRTIEFLRRCFASIQDTYVFISPGNHDCISGNDIYSSAMLGENVYTFGSQMSCVEIKEKNIRVYGCGFENRFTAHGMLDGFRAKTDAMANIMVMHCSLPPYTDTNPVTMQQIEESGLDYIAAGHIHSGGEIKKAGNATYAYSGVPEGRFFDEIGEKGIIIGEINKGETRTKFVKTSKREVCILETDVSDCLTYGDVIEKIGNLCPQNIYKIVLKGKTDRNVSFNKATLKDMLEKNVFFARIDDRTIDEIPHKTGLMERLFVEKVTNAGKNKEITERAIELGLRALGKEKLS